MNDLSSLLRHMHIPDWVNWLAQDADGTWWGFEVEPLLSHASWYENEVGRHIRLANSQPNPDWKQTLQAYSSKQISK